ncbi:MAG: peptide antibiotic transporter SbmA [Geminicoccaceae bacterium]
MFRSFFPAPRLFFGSAVLWTAISIAVWYLFGRDLGQSLSLGWVIGFEYPETLPADAAPELAAGIQTPLDKAINVWLYQYMFIIGAIFCVFWNWFAPHRWFRWSVVVSAFIVFVTWFQVQLSVMINNWFRTFYDLVQVALTEPGTVTQAQLFEQATTFLSIALTAVTVGVITHFVVSHYVFRWRTAMNDYYVANWSRFRHIEGASQRVQEDTMEFARIMESLGVRLIDAFMTLIAFLPILWGLSVYVTELPFIGEVPQALVIVAILWSVFGTGLIALAGIRLPGLEFRNQRVEAAYRKELVYGEDDETRAQPPTLGELFTDVRRNYFRLYINYLYFNVVRISYLQVGVLVPLIALTPTIAAGAITFGIYQQISRAFSQVESSFQYLINSWTTIVQLMSVYKRLRAFEAAIMDLPLDDIEFEVEPAGPVPGAEQS